MKQKKKYEHFSNEQFFEMQHSLNSNQFKTFNYDLKNDNYHFMVPNASLKTYTIRLINTSTLI